MPRRRTAAALTGRELRRHKRREAEFGSDQPPITLTEAQAELDAQRKDLATEIDTWAAERGLPPPDPRLRDLLASDMTTEDFLEAGDEPLSVALLEIDASLQFRRTAARALQIDGRRNTATAQLLSALQSYAASRSGALDAMIDCKPIGRSNQPIPFDAHERVLIAAAVTTLTRIAVFTSTAAVGAVIKELKDVGHPITRPAVLRICKRVADRTESPEAMDLDGADPPVCRGHKLVA